MNFLLKHPVDSVCKGVSVEEFNLDVCANLSAPFKIARFKLEPGGKSPIDSHLVQEIWIVISGQGRLYSQESSTQLVQGNAVHFPSFIDHWIENNGDTDLELITLWW